jgi:alpha-1,2-mannosyltransferase
VSTRSLAVFVVASFCSVQLLTLGFFRVPVGDSGLQPIAWFFTGRQGHDSWDPMAEAYRVATTEHRVQRPFYWRTAFSRQVIRKGFQYPPTALLVVSLLDRMAGVRPLEALRGITWAMVPITAALVWLLYDALCTGTGARDPRAACRADRLLSVAVAAFATLTFYPVMRAYANGQMQTWLNAAFAASAWCWATGRRGTAGALVALSCAVKPQLGVFVAWGLLRREWRFVAALAGVALLLLASSVGLYGWAAHVEYLGMLRFLGERGEAFFPNQSVNGLLNRWLFNGDILSWKQPWVDHFPPFDLRVFLPTVVGSVVLLALGIVPPRDPARRGSLVDFSLMALAATMASPIAWEHHYGVALPIFVAAWFGCVAGAPTSRARAAALGVSYVLVANCFWVTKALAASRLNVLQSYLFFGAIVLLAILVRERRTGRGKGPGETATRAADR